MTNRELEIAIARELHEAPTLPIDAAGIIARSAPEQASRTAILAELDDLRLLFVELHEALAAPDAQAALLTSRWTALHLVAHLASWAAETRREAEALIEGRGFDYAIHFERDGGPRPWNQREVDARGGLGLSALIDQLTHETERLMDLVVIAPREALDSVVELPRTSGDPPRRWQMPLGAMIVASCWHARLHLRRLLANDEI